MRRHLTFANVASALALFLALSGGAYAVGTKLKANSVGSKQVKPDSLTGADVNEAQLGRVPSATDAGTIDGVNSEAFARRGLTWTAVGEAHQSGNPPGRFTCMHSDGVVCDEYFQNLDGPGGRAHAAYARDEAGMVHLQGSIVFVSYQAGEVSPDEILDLPPGFRPADTRVFAVLESGTVLNRLDVGADGSLNLAQTIQNGEWISLDGISFPADPG